MAPDAVPFGASYLAWATALAGALALALGLTRRRTALAVVGGLLAGAGLGALLLTRVPVGSGEPPTEVGELLVYSGLGLATLLGVLLGTVKRWSFALAVVAGTLLATGVGALTLRDLGGRLFEGVRDIRGVQFVRPEWLLLLLVTPLVVVVGRKSLSGLGARRKWLAMGLRTAGLVALAVALAEPRFRQESDTNTVMFVVDRSYSVPQDIDPAKLGTAQDAGADRRWERVRTFIEDAVRQRPDARADDQAGLIFFGKRPKLVLPPASVRRFPVDERLAGALDGNYTDIAAAIKLALASFPEGSGKRIVLISDGNENLGVAEEQADAARKNKVEIDTVALAPGYRNESEVLVQAIETPPVVAKGQQLPVRVLVRNATPNTIVDGRLEVLRVGSSAGGEAEAVEVEDGPQVLEPGKAPKVRLLPGLNVFRFKNKISADSQASFTMRATFAPSESRPVQGGAVVAGLPGDRPINNRVETAIVARGQRRVLLLDDSDGGGKSQHGYLLDTLRFEPTAAGAAPKVKLRVDRLPADKLPADPGELGVLLSNYDAVILANVPYERFTADQAEVVRTAVFDQGCGLVMVGGPESFGAGGYQQTPIEAALPVDCEIKALQAAGKGGLVLVMHASEMADGNKWQKDIAKLAIQRLGPADMVGVCQYGGFGPGGVAWHIPFQEVGEVESGKRNRILARLDSLVPGDMPDFDPFLVAAYDTLSDPQYNLAVRHTIVISDGDPNYSGPGIKAVANMAKAGITCTTVGVATHGGTEKTKMKTIAEGTMDAAGKKGNFYDVTNPNQLPAIYIKESRRVSQSFVTNVAFDPERTGGAGSAEVLAPGLPRQLPKLYGMVRTTKKQNVLASMSLKGPSPYPDQEFPLLASWRYGLGKAVAFTADARTQPGGATQYWDKDWAGSEIYRRFWDQLINWAMREPERGRLLLTTSYQDGRVKVTADVRDEKDRPIPGVSLRGAVSLPRPLAPGEQAPKVEFRPKGGGQYEAEFAVDEAGSYFLNVQALTPTLDAAGNASLNPDGSPQVTVVDASRSGVTVPYSPEFADLESNAPLLKRLSERTGGKSFTDLDDLAALAKSGELFRAGAQGTRALLPFWFWLVFLAALCLLFDVAVRRISLDAREFAGESGKLWHRLRARPTEAESSEHLDRLLSRKRGVGETLAQARAAKRFDLDSAPATVAPAGADGFSGPTAPPPPPRPPAPKPPAEDEDDDPLARLRKAKERAKEQHRREQG